MLRRRSRGVAQFSQHMLGKAIDFNIQGVSVEELRVAGLRLQRGGVGFYPGSFVHVDVGSVRHWPRMTHDQLARVFPNGRTVHVPSDGQPLSGYALALADIEKRGRARPAFRSPPRAIPARSATRIASPPPPAEEGQHPAKLFGFSTDDEEDEDSARAGEYHRVAARRARRGAGRARAAAAGPPGRRSTSRRSCAQAAAASRSPPRPPRRSRCRRAPCRVRRLSHRADAQRARRDDRQHHFVAQGRRVRAADRVPPDLALAYAANAAAGQPAPGRRLRPRCRCARARHRRDHADREIPPKAGQRFNDPWLRGITLATSVHYDMNVTRLRQARRAPGAHDDDQAGLEPRDGLRRRSL